MVCYGTAEEELIEVIRQEPGLLRDWDDKYGDRMQKIVFIGRHLDKEELIRELDDVWNRFLKRGYNLWYDGISLYQRFYLIFLPYFH